MTNSILTAPVRILLLVSLGLTISRAIILPVIAVYLSKTLSMSQDAVGYVIGISLVLSVLSSLFGGHVVDKVDRRILLLVGFFVLAISNICFPFFDGAFSVLVVLSLSYSTVSVLEITLKAYIAQLVEVDQRIRVFHYVTRLMLSVMRSGRF